MNIFHHNGVRNGIFCKFVGVKMLVRIWHAV